MPLLRASLTIAGVAIIALGVLAVVTAVEGARGPTRLVGVFSYTWEMIFTAALIPIVAAMVLVSRMTRARAVAVVAGAVAIALGAAAIIAVLRLAGRIEVFLPLANWVPGTMLMVLWGWLAARAAVQAQRLPPAMSRAAGITSIGQVILFALALAAVLVFGTNSPGVNIAAGAAYGSIWIALGAGWIAGAARWIGGVDRSPEQMRTA